MTKKRFMLASAMFVLALSILACSFSASTASIKTVTLARDPDGAQPTTTFAPEDDVYALVEAANAPDDTTYKAVWTAVNAEGVDPNFKIDEATLTAGSGTHQFSLTNDNLWPAGQYKVDIYMNDKLEKTVEFQVASQ